MAIERIEAIPFRIPIRAGIGPIQSNIWGMDSALHVLIKVTDSDGVVGYGETTPRATIYGDTQTSTVAVVREWLEPALRNLEPWAFETAWERMDRVAHNLPAKAGIDEALHDIVGKKLGVNVRQLLGGLDRDRAPLGMIVPLGPPEEVAEKCMEAATRGIRCFKIKTGKDPKRDITAFKAVRRALGDDACLSIDVNQGYSVTDAIRVLHTLYDYDIAWAEEPVKAWDMEGKLKVARSVHVPLLLDESVFTPQDALREIKNGAAGLISIKTARSAFFRSRVISSICEAANVPCVLGSARESTVGSIVSAYFAASCRNIMATEIGDHVIFEASLLTEWPRIEDGYMILPSGPGLGIEIDEEQLERYRIDR